MHNVHAAADTIKPDVEQNQSLYVDSENASSRRFPVESDHAKGEKEKQKKRKEESWFCRERTLDVSHSASKHRHEADSHDRRLLDANQPTGGNEGSLGVDVLMNARRAHQRRNARQLNLKTAAAFCIW